MSELFASLYKDPRMGQIHYTAKLKGEIVDPVTIGKNVLTESGSRVGECCRIGENSKLKANSILETYCVVGDNVVIQKNVYAYPYAVIQTKDVPEYVIIHSYVKLTNKVEKGEIVIRSPSSEQLYKDSLPLEILPDGL